MSREVLEDQSVSHTIGPEMRKDAPLAFRISAELKRKLVRLAKREARSVSQVCEMLLQIGVEEYDKGGAAYLQRTVHQAHDKEQTQH